MYLKRQVNNCTKTADITEAEDKLSQAFALITKRDFPST